MAKNAKLEQNVDANVNVENTNVIPNVNTVINTMDSIFKPSNASDAQLDSARLKENKEMVKKNRGKFVCSKVYAPLYPDGFRSTYQGIIIELVFDGRTVELPESCIKYVNAKIAEKAEKTADRLNRFTNPKGAQEKIGDFQAY